MLLLRYGYYSYNNNITVMVPSFNKCIDYNVVLFAGRAVCIV